MTSETPNTSYAVTFNAANELYNQDRLTEYATIAQKLLTNPSTSKYIRMRCHIMVETILADWNEAL
jgi:hypothetical protein